MQGRCRSLTQASIIKNTNEENNNILSKLNSVRISKNKDINSIINNSTSINNGNIKLGFNKSIKKINCSDIISKSNINRVYNPIKNINSKQNINSANAIISSILTFNVYNSMSITNNFNRQFNDIINRLHSLRIQDQEKLNQILTDKSQNQRKMRNIGVKRAWEYEKAEVEMGGKGTGKWDKEQQKELLDTGKVRGAEGHHINNVADNPELQADPDNIIMAKDREQHRDMHNGDFRNSTEGELINRDRRLKDTNGKRIFKNELTGIGAAAAIGLGIGFTIGFSLQLAKIGVSPENLKNAVIAGGKVGGESAIMATVGHVVGRTIGELTAKVTEGVFNNWGMVITDNITKMCNMASIGVITITVFSIYQFTKLKLDGYSTKECIIRTAKGTLFSLLTLTISIIAQGILGGAAGVIVSTSIGLICISYTLVTTVHDRKLTEEIEVFIINKSMPILEGC